MNILSASLADPAVRERIVSLRSALGKRVFLVGHHYQHESVVEHCDARGDSLELARMVSTIDAQSIVFCGVYFMGESAAILAKPEQSVILPEDDAECMMAAMSPGTWVENVLKRLTASGRKLIPLAYVNTTVDVKAVVGRYGGSVCTSANAEKMLRWAMNEGDGVLFLPDKNLARNAAAQVGIAQDDIHILDIRQKGQAVDLDTATKASLVVWPGLCAIHARFFPRHVEAARAKHPNALIVAHPECSPAVINMSDISGSTTTIIQAVREAKPGSVVYVGTEINLVQRLAHEAAERDVTVIPLLESACSHMAQVTPQKLLNTLEQIEKNQAKPVQVNPEDVPYARLALDRMLQACA